MTNIKIVNKDEADNQDQKEPIEIGEAKEEVTEVVNEEPTLEEAVEEKPKPKVT